MGRALIEWGNVEKVKVSRGNGGLIVDRRIKIVDCGDGGSAIVG